MHLEIFLRFYVWPPTFWGRLCVDDKNEISKALQMHMSGLLCSWQFTLNRNVSPDYSRLTYYGQLHYSWNKSFTISKDDQREIQLWKWSNDILKFHAVLLYVAEIP